MMISLDLPSALRRLLVVVVVSGIFVGASPAIRAEKHRFHSFLGKTPPEITAAPEHWVGPAGAVELATLRGQVVWLEFNF